MTPFTSSFVAFILFAPFLVLAAPSTSFYPRSIRGLPADASHLALDEDTGELIAFNPSGEALGRFTSGPRSEADVFRRVAGACVDMSSDDVQKLPGWNALKAVAETNWGTGSYNVVTNDRDYSDYPAQSCVSTDVVRITPDGTPSCTLQASKSDGQEVGTNGTISMTHGSGTSSSTTTTVTKQSAIAIGEEVSATIEFPGIAEVGAKFTFTGTFTNTLSTATQNTVDGTVATIVTQANVAGKTCHLEFTTKTCTITGTGQVRMLGTGWVWFEYDSRTQGHFKWALNIDGVLTNQEDRSTFIDFKSATGTTSNSDFNGVCT
ncbi:hypothetical protein DFH09DRAFT_1053300 [Mycena vulgaris]|nr:hypothetical protein DFH09DRAFT_1053300 [Mycena vulgaris]